MEIEVASSEPCEVRIARLRNVLFKVLRPDARHVFHHLEASRTPDEWAQREHLLPEVLAELWDEGGRPHSGFPKELYCPLCREGVPNSGNEHDQRVQVIQHMTGVQVQRCAVMSELVELFNSRGNERFGEDALDEARRSFASKQDVKARPRRNRMTRP